MITVKPKETTVEFTKSNTTPISTKLKLFFIILQIIFSFDFGFVTYKSSRHRLIIKVLTATVSLACGMFSLFWIFHEKSLIFAMWYSKYLIQNYIYIFVLLFISDGKTFCKFLEYLQWIDLQLKTIYSPYTLDFKLILWCVVSFSYKVLLTVTYCTNFEECSQRIYVQILFSMSVLSMDFPLVIYYFIFRATYQRLVELRKFIKKRNSKVIQTQIIYKYLIDSIESIKKAYDPVFIVTLIINVPSLMLIIYQIIREIKHELKNSLGYATESIVVIALFAVIFIPAIAAASLSTEAYKIKVILHNMLLEEKDQQQQRDIQRFINYIEARPFKFYVLKVVRLDATLPVVILNLCITYLIVMLQVTHLY